MFIRVDIITKRHWIFYLCILSKNQQQKKTRSESMSVSARNPGQNSNSNIIIHKCVASMTNSTPSASLSVSIRKQFQKIVLILLKVICFESLWVFFNLQLLCDFNFNKCSRLSPSVNRLSLSFTALVTFCSPLYRKRNTLYYQNSLIYFFLIVIQDFTSSINYKSW